MRERGVYYHHDDYAGFWVRLGVIFVDVLVFSALSITLAAIALSNFPTRAMAIFTCSAIGSLGFGYFVALKRSRIRTLGYRVFRVRIVGIDGEKPGYWTLFVRSVFGFCGCSSVYCLVDLTWVLEDAHRQALRDKFARTYVIRSGAQPFGEGSIVYRQYEVLFGKFLFPEVERE
jgi:uncharacterized RDD family membrane protein YckC